MKKFLTVISLLLAMVMLAAIPVAADTPLAGAADTSKLVTYYANLSENEPIIDGEIEEGEYGQKVATSSVNLPVTNTNMDKVADNPAVPELRTGSFDLYVSVDKDYIYMAFEETGGVWDGDDAGDTAGDAPNEYNFRCNYKIRLGFVPENVTEFLQFAGYTTTGKGIDGWNTTFYSGRSGSGKADTNLGDNVSEWISDLIFAKYVMATDDVIAVGGLSSKNGNDNSKAGQYRAVCEFKIDKAALVNFLNDKCGTFYEELPSTMYFCIGTNAFRWTADGEGKDVDPARNNSLFFAANVKGEQGNFFEQGMTSSTAQEWLPCAITLPEISEETTAAPTTEAPTEAPVVTDAPTESVADQTEAPTTEAPAAAGGCGASISVAGMAIVAALGMGVTVVSRKRR